MKSTLCAAATTVFCSATGLAGELPAIFDKPYLGCFLGFSEARDFQFAVGADGTSELFFMKDRDVRLTTTGTTLHIYYVLEEKLEGKEGWVNRRMQEDGFETSFEATATPEMGKPVTFTATFTGDTKVEIAHVFEKDRVEITTKIVEKTSGNDMRAGVKVLVGDMYRHIRPEDGEELDKRDLRDKIEDSRMEVWPVGSKSSSAERIDLHETGETMQERFPKGATKFTMESVRLADHEYTISTADEDLGRIEFKQTRALYHGFYLWWWPDPAKVDDEDCRMVIAVD